MVKKSASGNGPSRTHSPTVKHKKPKNSTSDTGWKKIKQAECLLHHVKAVNTAVGKHVGYIKQKSFLHTYVTILEKEWLFNGTLNVGGDFQQKRGKGLH